MSEDTVQLATDGAGIWRDPSGIVTLAEQGNSHYDLDHGITVICDSHRGLVKRLAVFRETRKAGRKRIACPECSRMATVYVRRGGNDRRQ